MSAEDLNAITMFVFGLLLGVLGTIFLILGGLYAIFRPLWFTPSGGFPSLIKTMDTVVDLLEWVSRVQSEGIPRSRAIAVVTVLGLSLLVVLAIFLGPAKVEWIPLITGFLAGEFGSIGLFEASRLLASHRTSSPDDKP